MPLFGKTKSRSKDMTSEVIPRGQHPTSLTSPPQPPAPSMPQSHSTTPPAPKQTPRIAFHCQLAHGSPTGVISGFGNVRELYQKIAGCYDIDDTEIVFCTLNTHKADMSRLLGGQLGLDDFIFAHVKGRPKVVDIEKTGDALGLTITDNGAGYAFIKVIKPGSIVAGIEGICVGDHIEKVNDESMVGLRHFEVARRLKNMPQGTTFRLRVVEPLKSGFSYQRKIYGLSAFLYAVHLNGAQDKAEIGGKSVGPKKSNYGSGKETLRLRSNGTAKVEVADDLVNVAIDRINRLLENFLGISDTELAQSIWETGSAADNPSSFSTAMEDSDLSEFGFTESFIFDLWGAISDAKQGRLKKMQEFSEEF